MWLLAIVYYNILFGRFAYAGMMIVVVAVILANDDDDDDDDDEDDGIFPLSVSVDLL